MERRGWLKNGTLCKLATVAMVGTSLIWQGVGRPAAAQEAAQKSAAAVRKEGVEDPSKPAKPLIQMAILLDTSNSMDGLINQARTQLWKIVNEFALAKRNGQHPRLEVALYEYGNDRLPAKENFLRMVLPLTDDLDKVSEALFGLTTNGGQEYCGAVIQSAGRELQWSKKPGTLKCIFIAGNEPFDQGGVPYAESCKKVVAAGVTVNTIFCGPVAEGISTHWQHGAQLADGSYMSIDQNAVAAAIAAPQDKDLAELSTELNKTYVVYGAADKRKEFAERQAAQDSNASSAAPSAGAARAQFKASGLYSNSGYDLVDALRDKKVKLEDVKAEELPEELRKLSLEERKAAIASKEAERKALQEKIQHLSAAREKFLADARKSEAKDSSTTLDSAVIQAVRSQAAKLQYEFEPQK